MAYLFKSYEKNDIDATEQLITEIGPDVLFNKVTLLCFICHHGERDDDDLYVELLLKYGADPNKQTTIGFPINGILNRLHNGGLVVLNQLRLLLKFGADPNVIKNTLYIATLGNRNLHNVEMVKLLLSHGVCQVNPVNNMNWSPLYYATVRASNPIYYKVQDIKILKEIIDLLEWARTAYSIYGTNTIHKKNREDAKQIILRKKIEAETKKRLLEQKSIEESTSYFKLALNNLDYIQNNPIPDDIKNFYHTFTANLIIRGAQIMPPHALETLDYPEEFKELMSYKDQIIPIWSQMK